MTWCTKPGDGGAPCPRLRETRVGGWLSSDAHRYEDFDGRVPGMNERLL
jgi:hypothetical protein